MDPSANSLEGARASAQQPWLQVQGSRYFLDWLQEQRISLAFTTYQTGKLFLVGRKPDHAISVFERTYNHCMGMWAAPDGRTVWLSSRYQIWRLQQAPATAVPYAGSAAAETPADAGPPSWQGRGYDMAYVPRVGYTTGHLDVHDLAWEPYVGESFRDSHPVSERPAPLVVPPSGGPDPLKPALQTPVSAKPCSTSTRWAICKFSSKQVAGLPSLTTDTKTVPDTLSVTQTAEDTKSPQPNCPYGFEPRYHLERKEDLPCFATSCTAP